jgi:hypothetical protein
MTGSYFGKTLARHNEFVPGTKGYLVPENEEWDCKYSNFEEDKNGIVTIWELPYDQQEGWDGIGWAKRYAIGSDVAEGLGNEFSSQYVIDRLYNRMVAKIRSNRLDANEWAKLTWLLSNMYHSSGKPALSCTERNGAGQTTVKDLQKLKAPQYTKMVAGTEGKPFQKQIGWTQTQQSKHELMGDLKTYLKDTDQPIPDGNLINECSTFIKHDNGRLGHEDGKTDDDVFGFALTLQASYFQGEAPQRTGITEKAIEEREKQIEEANGTSAQAMREIDQIFKRYESDSDDDDDDDEEGMDW